MMIVAYAANQTVASGPNLTIFSKVEVVRASLRQMAR